MNSRYLLFLVFLLLSACSPARKLTYFTDLKDVATYEESVKNKVEPVIQPDDLLSISVSSLNPESNVLFNNGVLQTIGSSSAGATGRTSEGYLVDKNGAINFPVLGSVVLTGLTKEQATDKLTAEIRKTVKNPIVNIRFLNFRVTVIGEVNRPSTFTILNERINLIEVIGLAGDLTPYGKRENVLIIREKNGIRSATRVNLTSKSVLDSPSFYLQQNDIVYVEPIKTKLLQSSSSPFYLSTVSIVLSLLGVILFAFR